MGKVGSVPCVVAAAEQCASSALPLGEPSTSLWGGLLCLLMGALLLFCATSGCLTCGSLRCRTCQCGTFRPGGTALAIDCQNVKAGLVGQMQWLIRCDELGTNIV